MRSRSLCLLLLMFAVTAEAVPHRRVRVPGFGLLRDTLAFPNYKVRQGSPFPEFAQLAHCSSMAIMVRQFFYYASFAPTEPRADRATYLAKVRDIYESPTDLRPGTSGREVIPGFANLMEFSADPDMALILKEVMGDSVFDALHPNWNWLPHNQLDSTADSNMLMEAYLQSTIDQGRLAILYLTRGTNYAHAVTVYGYNETSAGRDYLVYDPRWPGLTIWSHYSMRERAFYHPVRGWRDAWILHPYSDMPAPPYPDRAWLYLMFP